MGEKSLMQLEINKRLRNLPVGFVFSGAQDWPAYGADILLDCPKVTPYKYFNLVERKTHPCTGRPEPAPVRCEQFLALRYDHASYHPC
jgi:hypothetical protein